MKTLKNEATILISYSKSLDGNFTSKYLTLKELSVVVKRFYWKSNDIICFDNRIEELENNLILILNSSLFVYDNRDFDIKSKSEVIYPSNEVEVLSKKFKQSRVKESSLKAQLEKIKKDRIKNQVTILEAEKQMKDFFQKSIAKKGKYLLKLPTGIGKTELLKYLYSPGGNTIIVSAPTNKLKEELDLRIKSEHFTTVSFPHFENEEINQHIEVLLKVGKFNDVFLMFKFAAKSGVIKLNTKKQYSISDDEKDCCYKYIKERFTIFNKSLKRKEDNPLIILTTHSKAILLASQEEFKDATFIFDEDPIEHFIETYEVQLPRYTSKRIIDFIKSLPYDKVADNKIKLELDLNIDLIKFQEKTIKKNNYKALSLTTFNYILKTKKNSNKNYSDTIVTFNYEVPQFNHLIIMSASSSISLYKGIYNDIEIFELDNVEKVGRILQNVKNSFTRGSFKKENVLNFFDEITKNADNIITFKDKKINENDLHLYDCSGYDHLKGQDLTVVGTPHIPSYKYLLLSKMINYDPNDISFFRQKINRKGLTFSFPTFSDPILSELQLESIEGELLQAIGRARVLRTTAEVKIFSNFPMYFADGFC